MPIQPVFIRLDQLLGPSLASGFDVLTQTVSQRLGELLPRVVGAVLILLLGWLAATLIAVIIRRRLKKCRLNQCFSRWLTRSQPPTTLFPLEEWLTIGSFVMLALFVMLAALEALGLESASTPLMLLFSNS